MSIKERMEIASPTAKMILSRLEALIALANDCKANINAAATNVTAPDVQSLDLDE